MSVRQIRVYGQWVWQARVSVSGQRRSRLAATRAEARQHEAEFLQSLRREADQIERVLDQPATVRMTFEGYAEDLEARGKGPDTIARAAQTAKAFEAVLPEWLDRPVSELGDKQVFAFRQGRDRAGAKPSTINRDLRTIRAMLRKARPEYRFPAGAFFREDDTRVRWLRPEEELLVLETMPSPCREIAKLAALTLMRLSEIRGLRRAYVHLEQGVVMLPRAKAGARAVVLSEAARKILQQQLERHQRDWVFPNPDGGPYSRVHVSRVFRKAARAAGLKDFHFHDLRHHGATMALNAGFSAPIVMALGGWKTERMMRRYAAVTDQTLRRAAEAVSGQNEPPVAAGRWATSVLQSGPHNETSGPHGGGT
jgi:integrase